MMQLQKTEKINVLAYQIEKIGNVYCGDSFYMLVTDESYLCVVADGLGSGEAAHVSSTAICQIIEQNKDESIETLMSLCNEEMKNKRGATVAILKIDLTTRECCYSSVGNIRFAFYIPSDRFIFPLPVSGYLSGKPQKYRIHRFQYEPESKFLMYTDGLSVTSNRPILKDSESVEEMSDSLKHLVPLRTDDLTYVVGQLF